MSRKRARARRRPRLSPRSPSKRPTASTTAGTPSPVAARVLSTGGRQAPASNSRNDSISSISAAALSTPGRSALFTTNTSAISMMPAFIAWTPSPASGMVTTIDTSAVLAMSTSA